MAHVLEISSRRNQLGSDSILKTSLGQIRWNTVVPLYNGHWRK